MIISKKITVEVNSIDDVICNICEKSCIPPNGPKDQMEGIEIFTHFGYWSKHDMEHHHAHVCEDCYFKHIFPLFKINCVSEDNFG